MNKIMLSWILCVLALVGLFAWLGTGVMTTPNATTASSGTALIESGFTLQNGAGKTVTDKDFRGRYMLIYFGYTHCPDLCPTTLLMMQNALTHLGPLAAKIQPIFITIDPARDTPKITADYASHFGDRMLGLSGTPAQIREAADHFKVYYSKVEDKDSALGYMMDHSGFIYLMGPDGRYLTHFSHTASEQTIQEGLAKYVH